MNEEKQYKLLFNKKISMESNVIDNKNKKKYIIVIDNDECIGSWSDLSLIYNIFKFELKIDKPDILTFIDIMTKTGCIRPFVKDFFERIIDLKKKNIVSKVIMCTAASNSEGWVTYLAELLNYWIDYPLYDEIIYRERMDIWHDIKDTDKYNSIGYIKNMDMIKHIIDNKYKCNHKDFEIIAIDDRPSNILNGKTIGIKPYIVAINIYNVLQMYTPSQFDILLTKYEKIINESWEKYLKNPLKYTNAFEDIQILNVMENIEKIIFS